MRWWWPSPTGNGARCCAPPGCRTRCPRPPRRWVCKLDSEAARYDARGLISTALRPWFAARTLAEVAAAFTDRSLLWGPYRSFEQMLAEDPRCSEANPMFRRTEHPGVGRFLTATSPLHFGAMARPSPGLAPSLGQHTRPVLQQLLGLDDAALDQLQAAGTIAAKD